MREAIQSAHRALSDERRRALSLLIDAVWWATTARQCGTAYAAQATGARFGAWRASVDRIERIEAEIARLTAWQAERRAAA